MLKEVATFSTFTDQFRYIHHIVSLNMYTYRADLINLVNVDYFQQLGLDSGSCFMEAGVFHLPQDLIF